MTAYIDSEYTLLERQLQLLGILTHIRHLDLKLRLLALIHNVKERHLPRHVVLKISLNLVHDIRIDTDTLLPGRTEAIERTRLDQALHHPLI